MQNNNLIVICSKNAAKNEAVKNVMQQYFESFDIKSLETSSGVSETPIDDEEGILGCYNRIKDALQQEPSGNYYVAMEGILSKNKFGTFICGWTVIYNKLLNEYYYGCSAKVKVPDEIISLTTKNKRLSDVVAKFTGNTGDKISTLGTNGLLTNGTYTRTDEFTDSIKCAISSKFKKLNKNIKTCVY